MVAALFAWHPVHVESVAWVSERKDVLSALFWLLAMPAYVNYTAKPGAGGYLLVLLLFALGLMAKPMVVTLPFVFLLLDWWPLGRFSALARPRRTPQKTPSNGPASRPRTWRFLLMEKIPFIALAAVSCVLTMIAQIRGQAVASIETVPLFDRMLNVLVSYARYVDKMIWPSGLSVIYPFQYFFLKTEVAVHGDGSGRHHLDSDCIAQKPSLSGGGVVLVSGNAGAGHRFCAGGSPIIRRPLHLHSLHWLFHYDLLGRP